MFPSEKLEAFFRSTETPGDTPGGSQTSARPLGENDDGTTASALSDPQESTRGNTPVRQRGRSSEDSPPLFSENPIFAASFGVDAGKMSTPPGQGGGTGPGGDAAQPSASRARPRVQLPPETGPSLATPVPPTPQAGGTIMHPDSTQGKYAVMKQLKQTPGIQSAIKAITAKKKKILEGEGAVNRDPSVSSSVWVDMAVANEVELKQKDRPTGQTLLEPPQNVLDLARNDGRSYGPKIDMAHLSTKQAAKSKRTGLLMYIIFLILFCFATLFPLRTFTVNANMGVKATTQRLMFQPQTGNLPDYAEHHGFVLEDAGNIEEELDGWDEGFAAVPDLNTWWEFVLGPLARSLYIDQLREEGDAVLPWWGDSESEANVGRVKTYRSAHTGSGVYLGDAIIRQLRVEPETCPSVYSADVDPFKDRKCYPEYNSGRQEERFVNFYSRGFSDGTLNPYFAGDENAPTYDSTDEWLVACRSHFYGEYNSTASFDYLASKTVDASVAMDLAVNASCANVEGAFHFVKSNGFRMWGRRETYSDSGYIYAMPASYKAFVAEMRMLRALGWAGPWSRGLFVDATVNFPSVLVTVSSRLTAEIDTVGGMTPGINHTTYRLSHFSAAAVTEIFYWIVLWLMIFQLALQFHTYGWEVFRDDSWVLIDILNYLLQVIIMCVTIYLKVEASRINERINDKISGSTAYGSDPCMEPPGLRDPGQCEDMLSYDFGAQAYGIRNALSFAALISWARLLGFIYVVPKVGSLWRALGKAFVPILIFLSMSFVVIFAFSHATYLSYGLYLSAFNTLPSSLMTQIRFFTGEVLYQDMDDVNRVMTPLLFTFMLLGSVFVVANVFIAIIMNYYDAELEEEAGFEFDDTYGAGDASDDPRSGFHSTLHNRLVVEDLDVFLSPLLSVELANGIYLRLGMNSNTQTVELQSVMFTKAWSARQAQQWWEEVKYMFEPGAALFYTVAAPFTRMGRFIKRQLSRKYDRNMGARQRAGSRIQSNTIGTLWHTSCRAMGLFTSPKRGLRHIADEAADWPEHEAFRSQQEEKLEMQVAAKTREAQIERQKNMVTASSGGGSPSKIKLSSKTAENIATSSWQALKDDTEFMAYKIMTELENLQHQMTNRGVLMSQLRVQCEKDLVDEVDDIPLASTREEYMVQADIQALMHGAEVLMKLDSQDSVGSKQSSDSRKLSSNLEVPSGTPKSLAQSVLQSEHDKAIRRRSTLEEDGWVTAQDWEALKEQNPLAMLKVQALHSGEGVEEPISRKLARWYTYGKLLAVSAFKCQLRQQHRLLTSGRRQTLSRAAAQRAAAKRKKRMRERRRRARAGSSVAWTAGSDKAKAALTGQSSIPKDAKKSASSSPARK